MKYPYLTTVYGNVKRKKVNESLNKSNFVQNSQRKKPLFRHKVGEKGFCG